MQKSDTVVFTLPPNMIQMSASAQQRADRASNKERDYTPAELQEKADRLKREQQERVDKQYADEAKKEKETSCKFLCYQFLCAEKEEIYDSDDDK
jgi:protein required for attachment to host cells